MSAIPPTDAALEPGAGGELREILRLLRERWWVVVAVVAILVVAAYARASAQTSQYQASALLSYSPGNPQLALLGGSAAVTAATPPDAAAIATNLAAIAKLATTGAVRRDAEAQVGPIRTPVSVSADPNSDLITVIAKASTPSRAARVANAWAHALVRVRLAASRAAAGAAIAVIHNELLQPGTRANRAALRGQLGSLRVLYKLQQSDVQLEQAAIPPIDRISPRPLRDAAIAAVAGLLLGVVILALIEALDRRLKSLSDAEREAGAPLLAALPPTTPGAVAAGRNDEVSVEAFRQLQANLTHTTLIRDVRTIAVTSPLEQEGKSTVALGLAIALSGSGRSVLLVDADFRRPTISNLLGLGREASALSALVTPGVPPPTPTRIDLRWSRERGAGQTPATPADGSLNGRALHAIGPGGPSSIGFDVLSLPGFASYLQESRNAWDYVIIDCAPLLPVSDTTPLISLVDGIVLALRLHHSRADALRRAVELIRRASGHLLGVAIATPKHDLGYAYRYGSGGAGGRYQLERSSAGKAV